MIWIVSYSNFFVGSLTVAGALTGLLFVALSVAQENADVSQSLERQAVASTAFTALVDALSGQPGRAAARRGAGRWPVHG